MNKNPTSDTGKSIGVRFDEEHCRNAVAAPPLLTAAWDVHMQSGEEVGPPAVATPPEHATGDSGSKNPAGYALHREIELLVLEDSFVLTPKSDVPDPPSLLIHRAKEKIALRPFVLPSSRRILRKSTVYGLLGTIRLHQGASPLPMGDCAFDIALFRKGPYLVVIRDREFVGKLQGKSRPADYCAHPWCASTGADALRRV